MRHSNPTASSYESQTHTQEQVSRLAACLLLHAEQTTWANIDTKSENLGSKNYSGHASAPCNAGEAMVAGGGGGGGGGCGGLEKHNANGRAGPL